MDDVIAVMDAAGSERAAIAGTLEGGPMAALFAATYPERVSALILYATFARATWAPGYEWAWSAEERDGAHGRAGRPLGRGVGGRRRGAQPHGRPGVQGVGRPARAAGGQPCDDQAHLRPDRRVRRARRAAVDPRAHARAPPPRGQLHQDRALALPRRAHPGREAGRARGRRQHVLARRQRGPAGRDRGVPDRRAPPSASRTGCWRPCCSPTSATPPSTRRRHGRPRLALPARAPRRALPARARAPPRPRGQAHRRRLPGHLRRARRARSAARPRSRRVGGLARAWRCARACTPASWR